ncbi:MAG: hypothetical protein L0216_21465 [Planctomycetales bacterium]|nr:hypothetical protein [Planctomycetales bacterium]
MRIPTRPIARLLLAAALALAAGRPAVADERGEPDAVPPSPSGPPWIAAEASLGLGWVSGSLRRDRAGVDGTDVSFRRHLDLDSPEVIPTGALLAFPGRGWSLRASLASAEFEGRRVQEGPSLFSPLPETLMLDGVVFQGQELRSRLRVLVADVSFDAPAWSRRDATLAAGAGALFASTELRVEGSSGARALETTETACPFALARLAAEIARGTRIRVEGRGGVLRLEDGGGRETSALLAAAVELGLSVRHVEARLRLEYLWVTSDRRRGRDDEVLSLALSGPAVWLGVRF